MKRVSLLAIVVAALVSAATAFAYTSLVSATSVKVTLAEFTLTGSPKIVNAGVVTFSVENRGKFRHEFVVLKTRTPAAKLRMNGMAAVETGKLGKIAALAPGKTRSIKLNLRAGHYALICNLPGHYQAGQRQDLTVK